MSLTDMVIMPGSDYSSACDELRELNGSTALIRSGQMSGMVAEANDEIADQTALLEQLAEALAGKAVSGGGGGGGTALSKCYMYDMANGIYLIVYFEPGMTWQDFERSSYNVLPDDQKLVSLNDNGQACWSWSGNTLKYDYMSAFGFDEIVPDAIYETY